MPLKIDYDAIASTFDRRYRDNLYPGVEAALTGFTGRSNAERVLEVGCGTGHWLRFLSERGTRIYGLDPFAHMLEYARAQAPEARLVQGVAERVPWIDSSFDGVFCINALHHFSDKPAALAEVHRVLRPSGRFMTVALDPHNGSDRWWIYDYFEPTRDIDRSRYPAVSKIREWMGSVGFVDCSTHEVQHLPVRLNARTAFAQGRLDRDATSQLSVLTDEQYRHGIERLQRAIEAAEEAGQTLDIRADLRLYATFGTAPGKGNHP